MAIGRDSESANSELITNKIFGANNIPSGFISGLNQSFITWCTMSGLLRVRGSTTPRRDTRPAYFKSNVLYAYVHIGILCNEQYEPDVVVDIFYVL
jgi:hypothetical protein